MKLITTSLVAIIVLCAGSVFADHMDPKTIDKRTARLTHVNVEAAAAVADASAGPRSADTIYNTYCMACHATGMANAPKPGTEMWDPIMARGKDDVLASAIAGKNVMPPKGTCADCSDEELWSTIEYMVSYGK